MTDNADSSVQTLDGLGLIQILKLKKKELDYERVKRMARIRVSDLIMDRSIPIHAYENADKPALSSVKFKPIHELRTPFIPVPSSYYSNLLWQLSSMLRKSLNPAPH